MGKGCAIFSRCILITKTTFPFALELMLDGSFKLELILDDSIKLIHAQTPVIKVIVMCSRCIFAFPAMTQRPYYRVCALTLRIYHTFFSFTLMNCKEI